MDRNVSPLGMFLLVIFGFESIVSLLGNGFIIVVYGQNWLHSRKMVPCEFLLTTLSLSRFLWQWVTVIRQFVYFSYPGTYIHSVNAGALKFAWMYLNSTSLWCATWLNVFYCVKVTNFAHPLFVWLKPRIGVLVPRFLGISLLVFIICSLPPIVTHYAENKYHNLTGNRVENNTQSETFGSHSPTMLNIIRLSFSAICFSICISASILLLVSLWRHMRNLKKGGFSTEDLSTQAHLRVVKPLLLLLFFYIVHIPAMFIAVGKILHYDRLERLISDIILASYPSTHSVILIFTNPTLKKACIHILNRRRSAS